MRVDRRRQAEAPRAAGLPRLSNRCRPVVFPAKRDAGVSNTGQPIPAKTDHANGLVRNPSEPAQIQGSSSPHGPTAHSREHIAAAAYANSKKWELRTRRPSIDAGDVVVLYATSPLRSVLGSFIAGEIVTGTPLEVWNSVRGEIAATRTSYLDAFGNAPVLHAIQVKRPRRIDPYTPKFAVGQGWRFLDGRANSSHRSVIRRIKDSR